MLYLLVGVGRCGAVFAYVGYDTISAKALLDERLDSLPLGLSIMSLVYRMRIRFRSKMVT